MRLTGNFKTCACLFKVPSHVAVVPRFDRQSLELSGTVSELICLDDILPSQFWLTPIPVHRCELSVCQSKIWIQFDRLLEKGHRSRVTKFLGCGECETVCF